MSLDAPGSYPRSRSKSPSGIERARSPVRAHSPMPDNDMPRYPYEYAEPRYAYADPPQAPDPPTQVEMPTPYQPYTQTPHRQYDIRPTSPDPGHSLPYAPSNPYEHAHVNAPYANPQQYAQYAPPAPPSQGRDEYTQAAQAAQQPAYTRGAPQEHPHYASPAPFQYGPPGGENSARPPPSPALEHARPHQYHGGPGYNSTMGTAGPGQSPAPSYVSSPAYGYQQPVASPPPVDPARGRPMAPPLAGPRDPNMASPEYAKPTGMGPEYARPHVFQYAQPDERIKYQYKTNKPPAEEPRTQEVQPKEIRPKEIKPKAEQAHDRYEEPKVVEIHPGGGALHAPSSPGLNRRMHRLSVSSNMGGPGEAGAVPPGSPLLEAYRGTYQSISPMPSPIMLPTAVDDDLSDLSALSGESSSDSDEDSDHDHGRHKKSRDHDMRLVQAKIKEKLQDKPEKKHKKKEETKKRVKFYDPEPDARDLAEALRHRNVDLDPMIDILPRLTHEQMMQLRDEYKKHARVQGKGINIAKHIKMKVGSGAFGKVCYATALGRWESEAYWANFWYQSNQSRRELLIESLMGRTNAEIREIKSAFSDKRYGDSLEKCMKAELKADKFRVAVLLVLEERKQEESNYVYADAVKDDVRRLHDCLVARTGGETAMIQIVVLRSETHMREVLKHYEKTYRKNFAKEMLRKSTNLVGETLAHILNGIINRPLRDALLIHQALTLEDSSSTSNAATSSTMSVSSSSTNPSSTTASSKDRTELLISRLVRYHWDRPHLEAIKTEYRARYGKELVTAVNEGTKGDFGDFCTELCLRRNAGAVAGGK